VAKREQDQEATFKKYKLRGYDNQGREIIDLVPLNSDWPTLVIDAENPGQIVGTMVEHRRYRSG
jgi:SOS-response transcriptional repressor LexA